LSTHQDEVTVKIRSKKPVLVGFLADIHIGAVSGHYKELKDRVDLLSETDDAYIISCGDTVDNYLPTFHGYEQFTVMCPPEVQKKLVEYIFSKLDGKLLALVQGCHDEASHSADDFDWTKYLTDKFGCANLGFGGFVNIQLDGQTYRIAARHKYRFSSSFNLTHTVKRLREQLGDFDIGCVAHNHQAAIEEVMQQDGKQRIFIRPGSFKGADRYSRFLGYKDTGGFIPTVLIFPNKRRMIPFLNLNDAVVVKEALQ
jgi:predicted MPP superfamily phosphohydrolase